MQLLLSLEFRQNAADFVSITPVGRPIPMKKMRVVGNCPNEKTILNICHVLFIGILTKTTVVMQMFNNKIEYATID